MLKLLVLLALAAVCLALPDDAWGGSTLDLVEAEKNDDQMEPSEVESLTSEATVDDTDVGARKKRWYICRVCRRCYWARYRVCGRICCLLGRWCRWYICRREKIILKEKREPVECKICRRCLYERYFPECKGRCCTIGYDCNSKYCSGRQDENEVAKPKIENAKLTVQSQDEGSVDRLEFCCTCGNCHSYCRQCGKRCCCRGGGGCNCTSCRRSGPSFFVNSI